MKTTNRKEKKVEHKIKVLFSVWHIGCAYEIAAISLKSKIFKETTAKKKLFKHGTYLLFCYFAVLSNWSPFDTTLLFFKVKMQI